MTDWAWLIAVAPPAGYWAAAEYRDRRRRERLAAAVDRYIAALGSDDLDGACDGLAEALR